MMPRFAANWRAMLASVGLDPDNASEDLTTPAGIGNVAGARVARERERDGMNQLGDEGRRQYNRRPYEDYTGYQPVNTAYKLSDPSRWQPLLNSPGNGTFAVQHFVKARPLSHHSIVIAGDHHDLSRGTGAQGDSRAALPHR
jgi:hypothetical protein